MNNLILFAPQWQDSGKSNELYYGALALKEYFEFNYKIDFKNIIIEQNQKDDSIENNILSFHIIKEQLAAISEKCYKNNPERIITIGGGCGIELPIVSYLSSKYTQLNLFWFDAHGDLNSPESSPSKYFHGMPLRFITEKQSNEIGEKYSIVSPKQVCLVGTRDLDPPEVEYIHLNNISVIKPSNNILKEINENIKDKKNSFIHIDLDVLDPAEYKNVKCPVNKGLKISELVSIMRIINDKTNIVGISLVENTEKDLHQINKLKDVIKIMVKLSEA